MRTRIAAVITVLVLVGTIALRQRSVSAADDDKSTWGAIDPAWSPDGKWLAFSLFGSIWRVPVEGGDAEQITTSGGYHAHPVWSPKDGSIAFIAGNPPAGRIPNIGGRLKIVDLSSGSEREVATPYPTAGTIAWSPDAQRIAIGLAVPNSGSLLHDVPLNGGAPRALQSLPQSATGSSWLASSYSRDSREIYFVGTRRGPPQVYSIPSGAPPIMVQLPLTPYRAGDLAQLEAASAGPDGSVVYAANLNNGTGNYELYRVPRDGGTPVAVTHTVRDEFGPAISPDGKWIAHVSNHLGNLDLFVIPATGGEKRHVRIGKLKFRGPSGRVRVKTVDENGQPTAVRLYVSAQDGRAYAPQGTMISYYSLMPGPTREGFFLASGEEEFVAPAGRMQLSALKGVEYRISQRTIDVPAGDTATVTIALERWTNWAARGWYTGENHFHANYNGSYYLKAKESLAWLQAEDLNTANMIVANSEGSFVHDKEFFRGGVDPISKPLYVLYWGQEYRNSNPLGHMAFLNIRKQVPPSFTSVIGSSSSIDFPLNTMAALEAKKQGGLVCYVHPISQAIGGDVFDTMLGAKEAPLTAALGAMDAIDVLPFGPNAYEMWYRFLNSGFRISPGAGTDVFTNWRGINNIPGGARQYVEVNGPMNWARWIERYREGRAFVTNAPLLRFDVNGNTMGSVIKAAQGQPYTARVTAEVTAKVPLTTLELIQNGRVVDTVSLANTMTGRIDKEVPIDRSSWLAVRATGPPAKGIPGGIPRAHSAPIYVHVGGEPVVIREDVELMIRWINRLWGYLEERDNMGTAANKTRARAMFDQGLAHYRAKLTAAR
jgi:TolB protein